MSDKNKPKKHKPLVGISIGDINGIGPEIIIKALDDPRMTRQCIPVIYASGSIISYYRKLLNRHNFSFNQTETAENIHPKKTNVVNSWNEKVEITPGEPNSIGGKYAVLSLRAAVSDLKEKKIQALVTAPISKELVQENDFDFPGHTEYLAAEAGQSDSLMTMVYDSLRVAVVTGHIPLGKVEGMISKELISHKLHMLIQSLKKDFGIKKPKIAVMGLNPHAGENGKIGMEDMEIITPVINEIKDKGDLIMGPYPADGFFGSSQFIHFDGILAMYHDQGLIPFKVLSHGEGVNFTAGLPFIRTSPAHGTAFNLAGKDVADPTSMRNAIFLALDLIKEKFPEHTDQY